MTLAELGCDFISEPWDASSRYMSVYYNGRYLEKSDVSISPDDRGFLFADGLYEVIHSYQGKLFKCRQHLERLAFGLSELRIEGVNARGLEAVACQLIEQNSLQSGDALIYIQVTRGAAPRTHEFPPSNTLPTVYVQAKAYSPPVELQKNGASAILAVDQR